MSNTFRKYSGEVDSFLFHLLGDANSTPELKAELQSQSKRSIPMAEAPAPFDLETIESLTGIQFAETSDIDDPEAPNDIPDFERGIPVILQVRDINWDGNQIDGFAATSRVGDVISGHAFPDAIQQLIDDPVVIRVDVSRDAGEAELDVSVPAVRGDVVQVPPIAEKGTDAIVAVIDGGLDVLHEAFQDASGKTRIIAYWDQYDSTGPAPLGDDGNPLYGTFYDSNAIDNMISANAVPVNMGRDPQGHGTHVASIAAGRQAIPFSGGMAPDAKIVFVRPKLHTPQGDPRSIGYSTAHVDALAFVDRIARQYDLPVSVNISLGMNGGAHDGTSTLEAAFDNFTSGGRMPGRVLVKSAGNAAAQGTHSHFQIGSEQMVSLQWRTQNVQRANDVIEVWFNSSDDLVFTLVEPGGASKSAAIGRSESLTTNGTFTNGNMYSIAFDRYYRDNGDARLTIMVSRGSSPRIAVGDWALQVEARQVLSAGHVDAWIERQRYTPAQFITHISIDGTLSIPGTANSVITVAALDRQMLGQVMSFSSRGTTRDGRKRPDIGAPGNNIEAARSGTSNSTVSMPGTSMAAPHVTGAIALLLSKRRGSGEPQLNANQIRAALNQSSRGYNGHWNSARGWGMLNTEALLALFN